MGDSRGGDRSQGRTLQVDYSQIIKPLLPRLKSLLGCGRVPARVSPELAAYRGVSDHKSDGIGNLFEADQPAELRVGEDILFDIILRHTLQQRGIDKSRVNDPGAHTMEHGFFH